MKEHDSCSSHVNGICSRIEDCKAYRGIKLRPSQADNLLDIVIRQKQGNYLKNHMCGFIPATENRTVEILYCCPEDTSEIIFEEESKENELNSTLRTESRTNFEKECMRSDGEWGTCMRDEKCTKMYRIIDQNIEEHFYKIDQNRCGRGKVCCAAEEVLEEANGCFDDHGEVGECEHMMECDAFLKVLSKYRSLDRSFPQEEITFWRRSKCPRKVSRILNFTFNG